MAKMSKEELIAKINEKLSDNSELAVELMEDVTDSMEVTDEYKIKYDELLEKYKQRFISPEVAEEKLEGEEVKTDNEEDKIIDVEEIFVDEKEDDE